MLTRVARSLTCNSGTLLITISVNGLCRVMWTSPCAMTFVNNRAHCVVSYFYTNSVAAHRRATLCIAPPWLATEAVRAVHLQSACSKVLCRSMLGVLRVLGAWYLLLALLLIAHTGGCQRSITVPHSNHRHTRTTAHITTIIITVIIAIITTTSLPKRHLPHHVPSPA